MNGGGTAIVEASSVVRTVGSTVERIWVSRSSWWNQESDSDISMGNPSVIAFSHQQIFVVATDTSVVVPGPERVSFAPYKDTCTYSSCRLYDDDVFISLVLIVSCFLVLLIGIFCIFLRSKRVVLFFVLCLVLVEGLAVGVC
jgi:hypothetical protein